MKYLEKLIERVIARVNVTLRGHGIDAGQYLRGLITPEKFVQYYAFYGLTTEHPLLIHFEHSSLAGSYFLGRCKAKHSILYKSDIRGDELKRKAKPFVAQGMAIDLHEDETISIEDSFLIKTLVHSFSHDPETPETFPIRNTVALPYANIHGSPSNGLFLGPFATVDLTTVRNSVIGAFSYVQVGELFNEVVEPGQILIRAKDVFEFKYQYPKSVLNRYVSLIPGSCPAGVMPNLVEQRKADFEKVFGYLYSTPPEGVPDTSFVSRYAALKGKTHVGENVLVAQRCYLDEAWLGKGANAQENCLIIHSRLSGPNVTAHGGKLIHCFLGKNVFVGFNSFLQGSPEYKFKVGDDCIVMPHTIVDLKEPVEVPSGHVVWGHIRTTADLEKHSIPIDKLAQVRGKFKKGHMSFDGDGGAFVCSFNKRIHHILEANGAYYDGEKNIGHAQNTQNIVYNIIQPYSESELKGVYPNVRIFPLEAA